MVGILDSLWDGPIAGAMFSFREGKDPMDEGMLSSLQDLSFVFAAGPGDDLTVFVDGVPYAWGLTVTKS